MQEAPQESSRQIARSLGVSHVTVEAVRDELEKSGQIVHFSERVDPRTGNASQPASKSPKTIIATTPQQADASLKLGDRTVT